jgi:hypothetical protein
MQGHRHCLCVGDIYLWGPPSRRAAAVFLCRSALAREWILLPPQMQADPPRSPASRLLQVQRQPRHPRHAVTPVTPSPRCGFIGIACALAIFIFGDHHRAGLPRCSFVGARLPAKGSYCRCRCKLTVRVRQQAGSYRCSVPPLGSCCRRTCKLTVRVRQQAGSYRSSVTPSRVLLPPQMQADPPRSPASRFLPVQYPPTVTPCKATGFTPCASCPVAADGR